MNLPSELDEYFDENTYLNNGNFWDPTDSARLQDLNDKLYSAFNKTAFSQQDHGKLKEVLMI